MNTLFVCTLLCVMPHMCKKARPTATSISTRTFTFSVCVGLRRKEGEEEEERRGGGEKRRDGTDERRKRREWLMFFFAIS